MNKKKDNTTLNHKVQLRTKVMGLIENPIILETHGGFGDVYRRCYSDVQNGIVLEKDPRKSAVLAKQRPSWMVYECDTLSAVRGGVGNLLPVNFIDVDPYGDPWNIIGAFFETLKNPQEKMVIAVNDGLRQKLKRNGGWSVESMQHVVQRYGNSELYRNYDKICLELMKEKAAKAGYSVDRWWVYYCGYAKQMTHYAAILKRPS